MCIRDRREGGREREKGREVPARGRHRSRSFASMPGSAIPYLSTAHLTACSTTRSVRTRRPVPHNDTLRQYWTPRRISCHTLCRCQRDNTACTAKSKTQELHPSYKLYLDCVFLSLIPHLGRRGGWERERDRLGRDDEDQPEEQHSELVAPYARSVPSSWHSTTGQYEW
eukprot:1489434-Rhodomonas_salina.1